VGQLNVRQAMRVAARIAVLLFGLTLLVMAPPADAACHAFTVTAKRSPVAEGTKAEVTVERDAAVNPSSVEITTVNGTAKAPGDYTATKQTVNFTNETSRTVTIPTREDTVHESAEQFTVELVEGSGGGCQVNQNFSYGSPAKFTISDDDAAPVTVTTAPTSSPTRIDTAAPPAAPSPSATPTPSPSPTISPSASPSPLPSASAFAVDTSEDGGLSPWLVAVALIGLAAASTGGIMLYRMRSGA
jgi:hypothetical protein